MNIKKAAGLWKISERRVRDLCATGIVIGAKSVDGVWFIPDDAPRPVDSRSLRYSGVPPELKIEFAQLEALRADIASRRPLSEGELSALRDQFLVEYTYHSNAIEGNTLTLNETALVLEGITIGEKPLKDHLEVTGHRDAYSYLESAVRDNIPFTENFILDLHYLVLAADPVNRGRYRRIPVVITGAAHILPQPFEVEPRMERWAFEYSRSRLHPIIAAARFHIEFETIHPFIDGNGRTGRLLANFALMRSGYLPISIKYEDRRGYYDAFTAYHRDHDNGLAMIRIFLTAERARLESYRSVLLASVV